MRITATLFYIRTASGRYVTDPDKPLDATSYDVRKAAQLDYAASRGLLEYLEGYGMGHYIDPVTP